MTATLWYPSYVYDKNEDITRENKRLYDIKHKALEAKCREVEPNYDNLTYREKFDIRRQAEKDLVW